MRIALLIQLLFVCIAAKAQVEIIPVVDTSLYIGIDNQVTIKSGKIPLEQLKLRTSAGAVSGSNGKYTITCSTRTKNALLEVLYKNKVVADKKITVNTIGDPIAYAVGERLFTGESISKKQLEGLSSLITKCNPSLINFKVVSFTAEIIHNGQPMGTVNNQSDIISKETRMYLLSAMSGDEIVFDTIKVLGPTDSRPRVVPSIKLKII